MVVAHPACWLCWANVLDSGTAVHALARLELLGALAQQLVGKAAESDLALVLGVGASLGSRAEPGFQPICHEMAKLTSRDVRGGPHLSTSR